MSGVDILAFEEVITNSTVNGDLMVIMTGIIISIAFIVGLIVSIRENEPGIFIAILLFGIFLSLIACLIIGTVTETPSEYETQYKVTISDDVSLNEFSARYEIIDQEGKIYTIRER